MTAKKLLVDGFAPFGRLTARYRKWSVTCADGATEVHSAWLLPTSKIAISEEVHAAENVDVIANVSIK